MRRCATGAWGGRWCLPLRAVSGLSCVGKCSRSRLLARPWSGTGSADGRMRTSPLSPARYRGWSCLMSIPSMAARKASRRSRQNRGSCPRQSRRGPVAEAGICISPIPGTMSATARALLPVSISAPMAGVIIVPPSIHPNGRRYCWREDRAPGDCTLAPLPPWLMEPRFSDTKPIGHSSAYWRSLVKNGVGEGQRNSTIASFAGHLLWHGVDPDVVMELLLAWNRTRCQPPLDDDEVIRTVRSIERTSARGERR
jgi:hypothetical protein